MDSIEVSRNYPLNHPHPKADQMGQLAKTILCWLHQISQDVLGVLVLRLNTRFCQIKELSGYFLPALSPCRFLSSLKVDKLTFLSAAKNLTHGLDLLSLNLLTYNQQNN